MPKPKKIRKPESPLPREPSPPKPNGGPVLDDFVMTIDDSDANVPDLDEEDPEKEEETLPDPVRGKKRKRSGDEGEPKKDDGGLDPDFEFQTGDLGDAVGDYDGWGFEGAKAAMKDSKKGVDIDEIIKRRSVKSNGAGMEAEDGTEDESNDEGADEDEDDYEEEDIEDKNMGDGDGEGQDVQFSGFGSDDEDVPADGFGMGADSSDDEDEVTPGRMNLKDFSKSGSDAEDSECSDSDSDSAVSEEVPHPDDLAESDGESDNPDAEEEARKAAYFAPDEDNVTTSDPTVSFQNMNLSRPILRGLANVGFTTPTLIQQKTIPVALLGKDVVGGAQTGSGKTAAFVVPILERLLYRPKKVATSRVLILCPTRELAMQAHSVAAKLAAYTDIKFALAVGGLSLKVQEAELKKRPDVIIATPGRFIDHMRNSSGFSVETIEIIVMDEADRMLEDGFADELNEIITTLPKSRQTMLFSATMTDSIDKLIRLSLNRPVRLLVNPKKSIVSTLVQEFIRIRPNREQYRLAMLLHLCTSDPTITRCIIFFRSKVFAHRVRVLFSLFSLRAAELHGSLTQEQRVKAVESFRDGKIDFLLATDLASRGLDIKGVQIVINCEAPQSHDIYTHRVGRTARAGRQGRAITLAAEADRKIVKTAVRAAQAQKAKVISRVLDNDAVNAVHKRLQDLEEEVDEVLKEEKQEKEIQQMEMQVRRSENMVKHEDEIKSRPKRTWFETQREKSEAKKVGKAELNGIVLPEKKERISGKKRKREEARETRETGVYKKTKTDRKERGAGLRGLVKGAIKKKATAGKMKVKTKSKGKGKGGKGR